MTITIETRVQAPISRVWDAFTTEADIMQWNAASDDWHTPAASNDLRVGGGFTYRMEAKDGSFGFDFSGTYTEVEVNDRIQYQLEDGRTVVISFMDDGDAVTVTESFDAENENDAEMQRAGWQAILDNFKQHVERTLE